MPWILDKMSAPGWEREFTSKAEATNELRRHVCADCLKNADPLATPCGSEFEIYDKDQGPRKRFYSTMKA